MDAQLSTSLSDAAPRPASRHAATPHIPAPAARANGPRLAELLGALSQALDQGEGHDVGHGLRACWIGQELGRALGLGAAEMRELYYAILLKDAGGSSNAPRLCALFLGDDRLFKRGCRMAGRRLGAVLRVVASHAGPQAGLGARLRMVVDTIQNGSEIARELIGLRASRGAQVARQLRFGDAVAEAIQCLDEHWDGGGQPEGLAGAEIPLHARIALLAQTVDILQARVGPLAAREEVARRAGRWFDPALADAFNIIARDPGFWRGLAGADLAQRLVDQEPARQPHPLDEDDLDDIAMAFGQVADAKSAWTGGHSARVALVADRVGEQLGLEAGVRRWLRRAAWLHDIGKLGVSTLLLDKPGELTPAERLDLQRHAAGTEQVLAGVASFGVLARVAGAHHEKLDGSGYPRGLDTRHIRLETRILTVADVFDALTAGRAGRAALPVEQALQAMRGGIGTAIDGDCFAALAKGAWALP